LNAGARAAESRRAAPRAAQRKKNCSGRIKKRPTNQGKQSNVLSEALWIGLLARAVRNNQRETAWTTSK